MRLVVCQTPTNPYARPHTMKLTAIAAIAAGLLSADSLELVAGTTFEVDDQALADKLIADGLAKSSEDPAIDLTKPSTPPASKSSKKVKARVLVDCTYGKPNDVVTVTADEAKQHAGVLDASPAAVAYAESLAA